MKLIIAILKDDDIDNIVQPLMAANFRVTRVASTGGFFRKGSTTLLIGVDDERVDAAIQVLRDKTTAPAGDEKRAIVFVVPVNRFEQI
jgi:uncharacterized protein YaaQ